MVKTQNFVIWIHTTSKTDDIYKGIAEDVDSRFGTLNYELDRPLRKVKIKK